MVNGGVDDNVDDNGDDKDEDEDDSIVNKVIENAEGERERVPVSIMYIFININVLFLVCRNAFSAIDEKLFINNSFMNKRFYMRASNWSQRKPGNSRREREKQS